MKKNQFKCDQCPTTEPDDGMDGWFTIIEPTKSYVLCPACYLARWQQMQPKTDADLVH